MEVSAIFEIEILFSEKSGSLKEDIEKNVLEFAQSFSDNAEINHNGIKSNVICPITLNQFLPQMRKVKKYFEDHLVKKKISLQTPFNEKSDFLAKKGVYVQLIFTIPALMSMDPNFVNEAFENLGLNIYFEIYMNGFLAIFETRDDLLKLGEIFTKFR